MLSKVLPSNSPLRRQLRFLSRRFNVAVTHKLRKNFAQPSPDGIEQLQELLKKAYFPSWYKGVDMDSFYNSQEGRTALHNHLFFRLELDRYEFIPWIDSVLRLNSARVLKIGCGTGSATVALAEQGATVTALDVHSEVLAAAELRCRIHGFSNVSFVQGNAQDIKGLFSDHRFDLIVFFAVLEHMTLAERKAALQAAWEIVPNGKYVCITDTPNRLWFYDAHTSHLPFFNWLPDELAFRYSELSPRFPFNTRFRKVSDESILSFIREGRGMSFHEIDLALGHNSGYKVVSDQIAFLSLRNPAKLLKRVVARDVNREKLLNSYAPERHRAFFRQDLDIVIKKVH